jgi:hypothetical protein
MSGCLFTNLSHVLAGLQKTGLSGFGGKMHFTEIAIETAWRETLEELFGFHSNFIKDRMVEICSIRPLRIMKSGNYVCFVYTFKDLEKALSILKKYHPISPYYRYFPMTVSDLILNRREFPGGPEGEVGALALLPVSAQSVAPEFLGDLTRLFARSPG